MEILTSTKVRVRQNTFLLCTKGQQILKKKISFRTGSTILSDTKVLIVSNTLIPQGQGDVRMDHLHHWVGETLFSD